MVELRSLSWSCTSTSASSQLDGPAPQALLQPPASGPTGFTLQMRVNLQPPSDWHPLVTIVGVLEVYLRSHDPADRERQNYPAYPVADGSVPVLEARLQLRSSDHPEWRQMTVGIPLGILTHPFGDHEVTVDYSGVQLRLLVDGQCLDGEFPFGEPPWEAAATWRLESPAVNRACFWAPRLASVPAADPVARPAAALSRHIQYWVPPGHNSWVGDVAALYHAGRYHLFYLYDRRHHQSKFGCGAHYFEHLSTADFQTWVEHEAATPLTQPWQCFGTGTPFVHAGRLHLSYGLHTTRVYPRERTSLPAQWAHLEAHGESGLFESDQAGWPAGSTYAACTDGAAHFDPCGHVFHPGENPSVFTDPAGRLRLLANAGARGLWGADAPTGPWRCLDADFPPGGDCTFYFRWRGYDYVVGGFTGFWCKPAAAPWSAFTDVVAHALDVYDGSNVPSVTVIPGDRLVMAAWVPVRGWGGFLVLRELVSLGEGRLGSRWLTEVTPGVAPPVAAFSRLHGAAEYSLAELGLGPYPASAAAGASGVVVSFAVCPGLAGGRVAVVLLPSAGQTAACEWRLDLASGRAQFGPGSPHDWGGEQRSLREGGAPHQAGDYAVEHVSGIEAGMGVRVLVRGDAKIGGTIVDVEIGGRRTMLSYRPDLSVASVRLRVEGAQLRDGTVAPLAQ